MKYIFMLLLISTSICAQPVPPFTLMSVAAGGAANPMVDSMVAYWPMDGLSDGHTGAYNLTGFNKVAWGDSVGVVGLASAVRRDSAQYAQVNNAQVSPMGGSFTIMWWAKDNPFAPEARVSLGWTAGLAGLPFYHYMQAGNNVIRLYNPTQVQVVGSLPTTTYSWRHFAVSYDAVTDTVYFYVNGSLRQRGLVTDPLANTTTAFTIGGTSGGGFSWDGVLDEVYFWRGYALTARANGYSSETITWYYNSGSGRTYNEVIAYSP